LRVIVSAEEALIKIEHDFPVPPTVLWDWLNDPRKRAQYTMQKGLEFRTIFLPNGRRGIGAQTHCMHGQNVAMKETVLDWKPFDYYTVEQDSGKLFGTTVTTFRFEPIQSGKATHLSIHIKGNILRGIFNRPLLKLIYGRVIFPTMVKHLSELIAKSQTDSSDPSPALPPPTNPHPTR
ncbi:MAG: SRPBCC family protein, partial [Anaerolineales bacterium]